MSEASHHTALLDEMVTGAIDAGIVHHTAQDDRLTGRTVRIEGRNLVNFSSCSYLGLELEPELIAGAADAARRYGTQFSSSRVYLSAPPYQELEARLGVLFGGEAIVTPSTTLGHLSSLPVLIGPRDAVLLDHHVHNSVQMAANLLRQAGSHVELIRHHDLEQLEERTSELARAHENVWFLVDGVCSMFGDFAPMPAFRALLDRHEQMRLYVDDAHGMSWCGKHGRGYALRDAELHPRMVLATSLNKAFGAAGGVLVFPDRELRRRVRTCGATLLFSGPVQPPMLGAALASTRIHLSPRITGFQERLQERTELCREWLAAEGLTTPADWRSPVQYVEIGLPGEAQRVIHAMMSDGFFPSVAQFPAVPVKRSGVRFTLTLHQRAEDVRGMLASLARHREAVLRERSATARTGTVRSAPLHAAVSHRVATRTYRVERATRIAQLDREEWDRLLGERANFSASALELLEACFAEASEPENRWRFHYYVVRDDEGEPVAATFCTNALWKADMLASADVSAAVEEQRLADPLHLTHRVFSMGSLLTEGDHLYLDPELGEPGEGETLEVMNQLLEAIAKDAREGDCGTVVLRDLAPPPRRFEAFLRDQGFVAMQAPDAFELRLDWKDRDDYLSRLTRRSRRHQRKRVEAFDDRFRVRFCSRGGDRASEADLRTFEALYQRVKRRSLDLNTFDLPSRFFELASDRDDWEIMALTPIDAPPNAPAVGMGVCYVGATRYVPLVIGLDDAHVESHGLYRQCLRHVVERARALEKDVLCLGMGAPLEKHRFGAVSQPRFLFVQANDHYVFDVIERMSLDLDARRGA